MSTQSSRRRQRFRRTISALAIADFCSTQVAVQAQQIKLDELIHCFSTSCVDIVGNDIHGSDNTQGGNIDDDDHDDYTQRNICNDIQCLVETVQGIDEHDEHVCFDGGNIDDDARDDDAQKLNTGGEAERCGVKFAESGRLPVVHEDEFTLLRVKMREFDLMGAYKEIDMVNFIPEEIGKEIRSWFQLMKDIELLCSRVDLSLDTLLHEIALEAISRLDIEDDHDDYAQHNIVCNDIQCLVATLQGIDVHDEHGCFDGGNIDDDAQNDYEQKEGQINTGAMAELCEVNFAEHVRLPVVHEDEFHQLRLKMREFDLMGVYKEVEMAGFFPEEMAKEFKTWLQAMKDIELLFSKVDLSLETLLHEIAMEDSTRLDFVVSSAGRHHNLDYEVLCRQRACSRISSLMPYSSLVRMKIQMSLKEKWTREDWTDFWRLKLFDFQDPSCNRKKAELFMQNLWLSEDESFLRDWPHWDANAFEVWTLSLCSSA
jgi:hypothetical protein